MASILFAFPSDPADLVEFSRAVLRVPLSEVQNLNDDRGAELAEGYAHDIGVNTLIEVPIIARAVAAEHCAALRDNFNRSRARGVGDQFAAFVWCVVNERLIRRGNGLVLPLPQIIDKLMDETDAQPAFAELAAELNGGRELVEAVAAVATFQTKWALPDTIFDRLWAVVNQ